jgi:hypothetical protein
MGGLDGSINCSDFSSLLALSALPVHAQTPGDVLQGVGRAMNGEPNRPPDWRDRERERAYWHEQHRLDAEQRDLDARRRALHDQRRYEEGNGYYGNGFYGPSR